MRAGSERSADPGLPYGSLPPATAHLCVDMQNMFAEETDWYTPWMREVVPAVTQLAQLRAAATIFTRFMPPEHPAQAQGRWQEYFSRWQQMTRARIEPRLLELVPPLAALAPPAIVLDKPAYSPFHGTPLLDLLRARKVDALVITGVETDVCVLAAVIAAVDHGFRVVVPKDGLCGSADQTHDALIKVYHDRFGQQVELTTIQAVIAAWRQ